MIHVLTQSIVYSMYMQFLHFKPCLAYTYDRNDLTLYNLLRAPYPTVITETQTQLWEQWNTPSLPMDPNNIGLINPTPTTYSANLLYQPQPGSKCSSECWGTYEKRGIPT